MDARIHGWKSEEEWCECVCVCARAHTWREQRARMCALKDKPVRCDTNV